MEDEENYNKLNRKGGEVADLPSLMNNQLVMEKVHQCSAGYRVPVIMMRLSKYKSY